MEFFFFSSRRRHTRYWRDWSSDVCSSDLGSYEPEDIEVVAVEPSPVMARQRPPDRPALIAPAEDLPLPDDAVDAALAVARKSVGEGKSGDLGCCRILIKKMRHRRRIHVII